MPQARHTYAELHLHLGGAILPRILYSHIQRSKADKSRPDLSNLAAQYLKRFPTYDRWERRLTRRSETLTQYLEAHRLTEPLQTIDALPYLVTRLLRGAYLFENIAYLELRYNPYFRISQPNPARLEEQMGEIVSTVAAAAAASYREFPIVFTQILCMDSRLDLATNRAILNVAKSLVDDVAGIDVAKPDELYKNIKDNILILLEEARKADLKVTAHVYETPDGCVEDFLPFLNRIGHGIQIPLREPRLLAQVARRGQCLEVCPTTYFRTGTLRSYDELRPVFRHCFDLGVDIAVCTDNMAFHEVRLPLEYERLLTHKVIDFRQMERCREAAFKHAFRWTGTVDRRDERLG